MLALLLSLTVASVSFQGGPVVGEYMGRPIARTMHWAGAGWLERETRESEEHTSRMLAALELEPGQVVCDLGCGVGTITLPMARLVGPAGKVVAVDIQLEMLAGLEQRLRAAGVTNVEAVAGDEKSARLAPASTDLVLMVDVYHELTFPAEVLASVHAALRPGGRLVLVEFRAEDASVPIKPEHRMERAQVERELAASGFRLARSFDELPWQHMLFFARADEPVRDEARRPHQALLGALARQPLVLFGEEHGIGESHALLRALLRDPLLGQRIDDVVVEFGNPLHQELVDAYVSGAEVAPEELARAWRDTAVPLAWDSPLYAEFYAAVRAANAGKPAEERLRLVLGETPIDWSRVRSAADYAPFADRSGDFARTVEREVLARGRRALLVIGGMHVLRRDPRNAFAAELPAFPGVGQWLAHEHPGQSLALWSVPVAAAADPLVAAWPVPALLPLRGRALGTTTFGHVAPTRVAIQREIDGERRWVPLARDDWPPMAEMVDALLWLGPTRTEVPAPRALYEDTAYVEELRRRVRLVDEFYGFDVYATELEQRLAAPAPR